MTLEPMQPSEPGKTRLLIAVASDLHAYSPGDINNRTDKSNNPPSHLKVMAAGDLYTPDPVRHLKNLIEDCNLRADILLSPGDIGDKASQEGIRYGWKCLNEIGSWLDVKLVAAASGNHDLDSRYMSSKYDPVEILQGLTPSYPLPEEEECDKYWSRKFVIRRTELYRLVIFNSSAYHGGNAGENLHGRISRATLDRLTKELKNDTKIPLVNIFLCHHHPLAFPELHTDDDTYDSMKNGQALLQLIGNGNYGQWLVIHGHKHQARILYAPGHGSAPTIFGAGSFSGCIYSEINSIARNQFYIIEIPLTSHIGMVGSITAWDWNPSGWAPSAKAGSGLPHQSAFGCKDTPQNLARRINQILGTINLMDWKTVIENIPELDFMLPNDFDLLIKELRNIFKVHVEFEDDTPKEIGRV